MRGEKKAKGTPKKPTPRPSTDWRAYPPTDALYWRLGGPDINEADIATIPYDTQYAVFYLKEPSAKVAALTRMIDQAKETLAEGLAYHKLLTEKGIDALKYEHDRKSDRDLDARPGDWLMSPRCVDRHRASSVLKIATCRGQIAACQALVAALESEVEAEILARESKKHPLLYRGGRKL
jgi:hypothetical protein